MTTTRTNAPRSDTKFKKQLTEQSIQIGNLRTRINELVDNMAVLQSDIDGFKKNVSKDLLAVIEALKEKK